MCIIAVKPQGVYMPSIKTLYNCWDGNTDGAGMAYWRPMDDKVTIDKGYMKMKALKNKLYQMDFGVDDIVVLHFRFGTHGLIDKGNCHPFPLSSKTMDLRTIIGQFECAIAHNGVFGNMACHDTLSDTQKFIGKIMANEAIINNLDNPAIQELIMGYCGSSSKLAILRANKLLLIGDFIKDDETGMMYSNHGYKSAVSYCQTNNRTGVSSYSAHKTYRPIIAGCCELCELDDKNKTSYREEFELFLCDECYKLNTQVII